MGSMQSQIRKFNPGLLQADEEVVSQFIVRENEFQLVGEVIRGNMDTPSCQHVLVLGSRGQGKSMLLRRLAAELRLDSELSGHFLPVQFMEENLEVDSLADFWMETLFQLAKELSSKDTGMSKKLFTTHKTLMTRWQEQGFEQLARSAVLSACNHLNRRLVLMVENVQSLFSEANDMGWGLRAVLQTIPQITLIASATSRFDALDNPQAPFFELFRLVYLKSLDTTECERLWSHLGNTESIGEEIRPLEILTGGNPRLIVVIASFAQHRSLRRLMEELVVLIDEHTDYFRNCLDVLPSNERRVFVALIDLWQPSKTAEIAERARMDVRVVSTMLKRLIDRGAVVIADPKASARKRLYVASERLFSLYYKLRREQNESSIVESLIHFMVSFYELREVILIADQLFTEARASSAIRAGIEGALASWEKSDEIISNQKRSAIANLSERVKNEERESRRNNALDELFRMHNAQKWHEVLMLINGFEAEGDC